jgi:leucyl aminopeptidase (aminopeptidase T)
VSSHPRPPVSGGPGATAGLEQAVHTVVARCLGIAEGEAALIVTDHATEDLGRALRAEAAAAGADAVLTVMDEREVDGAEPPATVAAALAAADVFIAPTARSISHTQARRRATDAGVRGATMPGVTADMLARVMSVELDALQRRSRAVAEVLDRADVARLTCPAGTDFHFDLTDRAAIADDGDLTAFAAFGNLPCGEGFISPAGGAGRLVASSLAALGRPPEPVELTVRDGALIDAAGDHGARFLALLATAGPRGTNLAELGVGTNDAATLTGNILEDEKVLGTVHVAFGASAGIGGTVTVPVHLDVVVLEPTLDVDGTRVLEAGAFVLPA